MRRECKAWISFSFILLVVVLMVTRCHGFVIPRTASCRPSQVLQVATTTGSSTTAATTASTATAPTTTHMEEDLSHVSTMEIKDRLVDLLSNMMGTAEDFQLVQAYVNTLEQRHVPPMTLDFLNLAMGGDWQLLFSTNLAKWSKTPTLRVRDLMQRIESQSLQGTVVNSCHWEWTERDDDDEDGSYASFVFGTFSTKCSYKITQGARMALELQDHILQPSKGSGLPKNVPKLVSLLHRTMPKELFDPSEHSMDITYLDGNLRIVRLTGPRLEGVRDIFIRRGSLEPSSSSSTATTTTSASATTSTTSTPSILQEGAME